MIDNQMTEEELAAQAKRYGHNYFRTCRGHRIRIQDDLTLRDALTLLEQANEDVSKARTIEHTICGGKEAYDAAKQSTVERELIRDDAKAQAEAAFYRTTGRWPHHLYGLGLR